MQHDRLRDTVAEAIAVEGDRTLARSLLNTDQAGEIAAIIAEFSENELGAPIDELEFFELSVAAVFGVRLNNARRFVVKVFRPDKGRRFLNGLITVQQHLADSGFPCPTVLGAARSFSSSRAFVMPMLDQGTYVDATEPTVRAEWAALLARQMETCSSFAGLPAFGAWRPPSGRLWPDPHNALFDFERHRKGAEWIDAIAAKALEQLAEQSTSPVLGHADWSAKHFRYSPHRPVGQRITAVYDWDSLRRGTEVEFVAGAAMTFSVNWYVPGLDVLPALEDSLAFVLDYEFARSTHFSTRERKAMVAAACYARAYTARCEHSLDPQAEKVAERSGRATLHDVVNYFRL